MVGRARVDAERIDFFSLRLGGGFHFEDAEDRAGIAGRTPTGFEFWRSPTVAGTVWIAEGHGVVLVGPVQVTIEGAAASGGAPRTRTATPTPRAPSWIRFSRGGRLERWPGW